MRFQVKTGSESHTTEWRSAMVTINGVEIYKALKPLTSEWELVGNKGKHGKWCIAEYEIPSGSHVVFTAKANSRSPIIQEFIVGSEEHDYEGYKYNNDICGWIVSI